VSPDSGKGSNLEVTKVISLRCYFVNGVNWQTLLMKAPIQRRNGTRRRKDMSPLRISKILVREHQGLKQASLANKIFFFITKIKIC